MPTRTCAASKSSSAPTAAIPGRTPRERRAATARMNLASSIAPTGFAHEYMWASSVDIGSVYNADVEIRITPTDSVAGVAGTDASTANFSVNNTLLPEPGDQRRTCPRSRPAQPFNFVVTLKNQSGTIDLASDSLQFSSSDPNAVVPSNGSNLTSGVGSFSATLNTVGQQWIAVDDSTPAPPRNSISTCLAAATQLGFTTSPQTLDGRHRFGHDHDRFGKRLRQPGQRIKPGDGQSEFDLRDRHVFAVVADDPGRSPARSASSTPTRRRGRPRSPRRQPV